jgi:hypothetical protein
MGSDRPPAGTRLRAWLVTGPLGHAWAGALDWLALAARVAAARARGRDPWS